MQHTMQIGARECAAGVAAIADAIALRPGTRKGERRAHAGRHWTGLIASVLLMLLLVRPAVAQLSTPVATDPVTPPAAAATSNPTNPNPAEAARAREVQARALRCAQGPASERAQCDLQTTLLATCGHLSGLRRAYQECITPHLPERQADDCSKFEGANRTGCEQGNAVREQCKGLKGDAREACVRPLVARNLPPIQVVSQPSVSRAPPALENGPPALPAPARPPGLPAEMVKPAAR